MVEKVDKLKEIQIKAKQKAQLGWGNEGEQGGEGLLIVMLENYFEIKENMVSLWTGGEVT